MTDQNKAALKWINREISHVENIGLGSIDIFETIRSALNAASVADELAEALKMLADGK